MTACDAARRQWMSRTRSSGALLRAGLVTEGVRCRAAPALEGTMERGRLGVSLGGTSPRQSTASCRRGTTPLPLVSQRRTSLRTMCQPWPAVAAAYGAWWTACAQPTRSSDPPTSAESRGRRESHHERLPSPGAARESRPPAARGMSVATNRAVSTEFASRRRTAPTRSTTRVRARDSRAPPHIDGRRRARA
jgi:hypothetical protein